MVAMPEGSCYIRTIGYDNNDVKTSVFVHRVKGLTTVIVESKVFDLKSTKKEVDDYTAILAEKYLR